MGTETAASVYWFHPRCAAYRQPERFATLVRESEAAAELPDGRCLLAEADLGITYERLPRLAGAEKASSGRARCRQCRELIAGGVWRVRLTAFEQSGFFEPLGFIHVGCAREYFAIPDLALLGDRIRQACPEMEAATIDEILSGGAPEGGSPQPP